MNIEKLKIMLEKKAKENNPNDVKKIELISSLFNNENCFFDIDMKLAIDILYFLGIEKEKLLETYYELLKPENYKKDSTIELVDLNL